MRRIVNPSVLGIDFDDDFMKESFTMREYLIDRFVEKAIDKVEG